MESGSGGNLFFDGRLAFIMATLRTHTVIFHCCTAILTGSKGRSDGIVMRPSFISSLF
jgi:hypothetical protein